MDSHGRSLEAAEKGLQRKGVVNFGGFTPRVEGLTPFQRTTFKERPTFTTPFARALFSLSRLSLSCARSLPAPRVKYTITITITITITNTMLLLHIIVIIIISSSNMSIITIE